MYMMDNFAVGHYMYVFSICRGYSARCWESYSNSENFIIGAATQHNQAPRLSNFFHAQLN